MNPKKFSSTAAAIFILTFFSGQSISGQAVIEANGDISSSTTWSHDTVNITADIRVLDEVTLTIAPGTIVKFRDHYRFTVIGTLKAEGAPNDSIVFTVADTSGFYRDSTASGGWGGLIFNNDNNYGGADGAMDDNDSSILSHCIVEYAKGTMDFGYDYVAMSGGIMIMAFSNLRIEDSQVRRNKAINSGGGISCVEFSNPVIHRNIISQNEARNGGGVAIGQSEPTFFNNAIRRNTNGRFGSYGRGAGINIWSSRVVIDSNEISYNENIGEGGGIYVSDSDCLFRNNSVFSNLSDRGAALFIRQQSNPWFVNNAFFNNLATSSGGAIYCETASARFISNLIHNNENSGIII